MFRYVSPIIAGLALALAGCGEGTDHRSAEASRRAEIQDTGASYRDISVAELRTMMEEDPFLVNVHIPFQGDLPHTDGSIRFDRIAQHLNELPGDKDANIVLYCRSGRMSAEAAAVLAGLGYTNVSNLQGGFLAWEAAGFEILMDPRGE